MIGMKNRKIKKIIDPEEKRYHQNYPKFPGVGTCVRLLRSSNVKGAYLDALLGDLVDHLPEHLAEVIAAFRAEPDERVRIMLIDAISEVAPPEALEFFVENVNSPNASIRFWAERGLEKMESKEARAALWRARTRNAGSI